ncbi:MAG: hypothetical protein RIA69_03925 [Cyclobacteriaceae bacterium]
MKKTQTLHTNSLSLLSLLCIALFTFSCEESDDEVTKDEDNTSSISVDKNTVIVGESSASLDIYTYFRGEDFNADGKTYLNIVALQGPFSANSPSISLFIKDMPASSTTLNWQTSSNAVGDLTASEFMLQVHDGNKRWYGEYGSPAYNTTGSLDVKIEGDVATFSFADIELGDKFLAGQSTETKKCSGSFSVTISEIDPTSGRGGEGNLVY